MNPSQKSPIEYMETTEQRRLNEAREKGNPLEEMGTVPSERQWEVQFAKTTVATRQCLGIFQP